VMLVLVVTGFITVATRPPKSSIAGMAGAILPGVLMLVLFYSLAVHMHLALGKWPPHRGDEGFPSVLIFHGFLARSLFLLLLLVAFFVWPPAFLVCLLVRSTRPYAYYLGWFGVVTIVCYLLAYLAPGDFLDWVWMDG
jgi:hypothetical protein